MHWCSCFVNKQLCAFNIPFVHRRDFTEKKNPNLAFGFYPISKHFFWLFLEDLLTHRCHFFYGLGLLIHCFSPFHIFIALLKFVSLASIERQESSYKLLDFLYSIIYISWSFVGGISSLSLDKDEGDTCPPHLLLAVMLEGWRCTKFSSSTNRKKL